MCPYNTFLTSQRCQDLLQLMHRFYTRTTALNECRTLFWSENTDLWYRTQGLYWGQADFDGVLVRPEMTTLKQCWFLMVMWYLACWHPGVLEPLLCNYCQANGSCMTMDHGDPHGWLLYMVHGAAIKWVLTIPTSRTQSLTCSEDAHLSDL